MTRKMILIIEDEEDIRDYLREFLVRDGYEVASAIHGQHGLELLRAGLKPHAILLDLMMPVMGGADFLEHKGQDPAIAGIPVIALTAAMDKLTPAGIRALVRKPFKMAHLRSSLSSLWPGEDQRTASSTTPPKPVVQYQP